MAGLMQMYGRLVPQFGQSGVGLYRIPGLGFDEVEVGQQIAGPEQSGQFRPEPVGKGGQDAHDFAPFFVGEFAMGSI